MHSFTPGPHRLATAVGVMWGTHDQITAADDAFLAIIGYSRDDLEQGRVDWRAMTPPEYVHLDEAGIRQAAETGGFTVPYQKEFIRKDGSRVPVLLCCAFVPDMPGGWMGHVVDLTNRSSGTATAEAPPVGAPIPVATEEFHRRLIGELVNERTSMIAMLDASPSLFWSVDARCRLIGANSAFQAAHRRMSGRSLEIGESVLHDGFSPAVLENWRQLYERALAGEHITRELDDTVDGVRFRYHNVLAPMRDSGGTIYGVTCASHDVSDRLAAEDAMRASEMRFRTLASKAPLGILQADAAGKVIYANERLQQIWQLPAEAMLGDGPITRLHPDDRARVLRQWQAAVADGQDVQLEFRLLLPDEEVRHVRAWFSCLHEEGRANGFVASIEDATESHAIEQRTRQRDRLESLGTLAGGIAHDFNNMLGIVLGYTELGLNDRTVPAAVAMDLKEIRTASLRARDLVRQILTFSRQGDALLAPVNIAALTHESVRLLRATLPSQIAFSVRVPDMAGTVLGNASALQQVIVNLCINAEHALRSTERPQIAITLAPVTRDGHAFVELTVRDNGHGMPEKVADRVFEPFFTTKRQGEGTGMGLAVVHGTVTAHGGTIHVTTAPGRGTTFVITLPLTEPAVGTDDSTQVTLRGSGHVLVVEDEPPLAAALSASLRRAGFDVSTCHRGDEALHMLDAGEARPDVVVSDVSMPGLTGDRLAELLATRHPTLPIVLMTGYSERVSPDGPRGPNVIAVLQKPVSSAALASVLDHVLT